MTKETACDYCGAPAGAHMYNFFAESARKGREVSNCWIEVQVEAVNPDCYPPKGQNYPSLRLCRKCAYKLARRAMQKDRRD